MKKVGDNIKTLRQSLKLTQEEFAKKAKISRSYLGDLENNRRNPSTETIKKLSKNTGISSSFLITGVPTFGDEYVLGMEYFEEIPSKFTDKEVDLIDKLMLKSAKKALLALEEVNLENYDKFEILNFDTTLNLIKIKTDENNPINIRKIAQLALVLENAVYHILKMSDSNDNKEKVYRVGEYFKIQEQLSELIREYQ